MLTLPTLRALLLGPITLLIASPLGAQLIGTAGNYGAFAGSTVTNTGPTLILGGLGVSPGSAITGFAAVDGGPGLFTGTLSQANAVATQAAIDIHASYDALAALSFGTDLTGQDLGGLVLTPGVYRFTSSAQLTGTLTLDAQGDADARFVFQIGSTLTTASNSLVALINPAIGMECGPESGLYWQIGSSATIGTGSDFAGNLLALSSITLDTGASIDYGRALAINGAVTLDSNRIDASDIDGGFCFAATPVPEPGTYGLAGCGLLLFATWRHRRQKHACSHA
jgi:hypothetical protein